jgi:hypothetical protein
MRADPFNTPYPIYPDPAGLRPHPQARGIIATTIAIVPYMRFYEVFI